jgi:hypothetical protein
MHAMMSGVSRSLAMADPSNQRKPSPTFFGHSSIDSADGTVRDHGLPPLRPPWTDARDDGRGRS